MKIQLEHEPFDHPEMDVEDRFSEDGLLEIGVYGYDGYNVATLDEDDVESLIEALSVALLERHS